ncbi:Armadillo-like helical [Penicillium sp. DV-2018c]|nr:Armadillo-like helical [Penicillium sp. DV-2018c]KAJ5581607.1 Armadillo-like helical [Penicillium sp. DV-2018c]
MNWQPEEAPLRQLAGYLRDSLNGSNPQGRAQAEQMLAQATSSPDYINYITYIFSTPHPVPAGINENEYSTVRFAAAVNVKTKISLAYNTISPQSLLYIKSAALLTLRDTDRNVSNAAGTIITAMVLQGGLLAWPEIVSELLTLVANASQTGDVPMPAREAAMDAMLKVCEDNRKVLDRDYHGQRPLDMIIPSLLQFTSIESSRIRVAALNAIHVFLPYKPEALMSSIDQFLSQLFNLAGDNNSGVRQMVCQSFSQLLEAAPEKLVPHMEGLVNYILMQQQSTDDPELALDAAEFWIGAGEQPLLKAELAPYMPKIIPVLLQGMVYDEDEVAQLMDEQDDAEIEDRAEDMKPQFAKSKGNRLNMSKPGEPPMPVLVSEDDEDDLSEGEIEDSEFGDDPSGVWTLRKCSAAALDIFATVYHRPVFEILLPYLTETLRHEQWPNREAAVLTLGAVAEGCMDAIKPHLQTLVPYLITLLNDAQPVVRQITCWCLARYSGWAAHIPDPEVRARFFEPMMEGILQRMLDNNKKVQEAAASAFASLEEKAEEQLAPYCEPILRQFVQCFGKYKDRNMYMLYDCIQTLAECVMSELAQPHLVDMLMPALIGRYNIVSDESRELFPLLECLGYIANAYGDTFAQFAPPIFARCVKIIYANLQASIQSASYQYEAPDKDFLVTSIDLVSAIIQAIDPQKSGELVRTSQPSFFELLRYCMEDDGYEVRQSTYALLGDCAISIFPQMESSLSTIVPILIKQLDLDLIRDDDRHTGFSVLNNACWSCGEIAVHENAPLAPYAEQLYRGLLNIIINEEVIDSVNENAALALGRLGFCCSDQIAPHLSECSGSFLRSMDKIDFTREKASAFLGFNQIVMKNPQAMEASLLDYFQAIAMFPARSLAQEEYRDIQGSFQQVLQGYKNLIPDFDNFLGQLNPPVAQTLRTLYHV